jgi:hypothetical protein
MTLLSEEDPGMLWDTLNEVDGDGNIVPRRRVMPPKNEG